MRKTSVLSSAVLVLALGLVGALGLAALGGPAALSTGTALPRLGGASSVSSQGGAQNSGITIEFLGWSFYRMTSPTGKIVLTNPFIEGNADAAVTLQEVIARGADIIVVADGHRDEQGNTLEIAPATGARVVTPDFAMGTWFAEKGIPRPQLSFTSPGDVYRHEGITVRVLGSVHGSTPPSPSDTVYYPGVAASFMITFENGYTIYFSGSSAATGDMAMWADMYKPDAIIAHQSAAHEPRDAAMVVKLMANNNPNLKTVFPHHFRLQPQPGGLFRPSDLRTEIERLGVSVNFIEPNPLQPYNLTK
jgi:L-ascorbate metabolism protein UlaG (beta-lactamase superfamily)